MFTFENVIQNDFINNNKIKEEGQSINNSISDDLRNDDTDVLHNQTNYDLKKFDAIENENIHNFDKKFGKLYKTFDVGYVKNRIWDTIKEIKSNLKIMTFDNVINKISETLDEKIIENISTSTCFVCLLHLANEKGKIIINF